jgi:hypothetical protein
MTNPASPPDPLRLIAAAILGIISGGILFLIITLGIGIINDRMNMNIPISLLVAENIFSAVLLILLILVCVAYLCRMVWLTPPTEESEE